MSFGILFKTKIWWKSNIVLYGYMKTNDIYKGIAEDVKTRFDTLNYEVDRPLPKRKNKQMIGLMKDELGGKIVIKVFGLRAKTYSYLLDDSSDNKKAKGTKKCVIKRKLKFESYKNCLKISQLDNKRSYLGKSKINVDSLKSDHKEFIKFNKLILKTQQRFKSERHHAFTKEINYGQMMLKNAIS